jgi:hypothetical protein
VTRRLPSSSIWREVIAFGGVGFVEACKMEAELIFEARQAATPAVAPPTTAASTMSFPGGGCFEACGGAVLRLPIR